VSWAASVEALTWWAGPAGASRPRGRYHRA